MSNAKVNQAGSQVRRFSAYVIGIAVLAGTGFAVGWAARTLTDEAKLAGTEPASAPTYETRIGLLEDERLVKPFLEWGISRPLVNHRAGIVTSVGIRSGEVLAQGSELIRVNDQPLFVLEGEMPAYRDLQLTTPRQLGGDVRALQAYLNGLGLEVAVTGEFDRATRDAVRIWQKYSGQPSNGIIELGSIVFVPSGSVRLKLDAGIAVGSQIEAGDLLGDLVEPIPTVTLQLGSTAGRIEPGMRVTDETGFTVGKISAIGAEPIPGSDLFETVAQVSTSATAMSTLCDETCLRESIAGIKSLPALLVEVLPPVEGPMVPINAIWLNQLGEPTVVDSDGTEHPVQVVAESDGFAVLSGVELPLTVRLGNPL